MLLFRLLFDVHGLCSWVEPCGVEGVRGVGDDGLAPSWGRTALGSVLAEKRLCKPSSVLDYCSKVRLQCLCALFHNIPPPSPCSPSPTPATPGRMIRVTRPDEAQGARISKENSQDRRHS